MSCPRCRHCTDYTSPEAIAVGHGTPVLKIPHVAALLAVAAPTGALEAILRWAEGLRGRKGPSRQDVTLVGHDDEWTKLLIAQAPIVVGGARRGNGQEVA